MANKKKFNIDIERGKVGEMIVYNYLLSLPHTKEVIDVSDDKEYQKQDIDFIVKTDTYKYTVEVKYDSVVHKSNNFPYEYYSDKDNKSVGCMEKTQADFVFLLSDVTHQCYIVGVRSIRHFVHRQLAEQAQDKTIGNARLIWKEMGDKAIGFLIPLNRLEDYNITFKKVNLKKYLTIGE